MDLAIRVRDLHKGFDGKQVLRGVDLDIERGKINVIIGASGGGKTVLLKHLDGLLRPIRVTSGSTVRTSPRWTTAS